MKFTKKEVAISSLVVTVILTIDFLIVYYLYKLISPLIPNFVGFITIILFIIFYQIGLLLYGKLLRKLNPIDDCIIHIDDDSVDLNYWKQLMFVYEMTAGIFSNVVPEILRVPYYSLFGFKAGKESLVAGKIVDPWMVSIGNQTQTGDDSLLTSHAITKEQIILSKIVIGNNVQIGAKAVIMPGVRIGDNSVVAANSLVTTNTIIGENEIWAGNPAKKIRDIKPIVSNSNSNGDTDISLKVRNMLLSKFNLPNFSNDDNLVDKGLVNSLSFIDFISSIEDEFRVKLDNSFELQSVNLVSGAVIKEQNKQNTESNIESIFKINVRAQLIDLASTLFNLPKNLDENLSLIDSGYINSLSFNSFIAAIEKKFSIFFSGIDIFQMQSIAKIEGYITSQLRKNNTSSLNINKLSGTDFSGVAPIVATLAMVFLVVFFAGNFLNVKDMTVGRVYGENQFYVGGDLVDNLSSLKYTFTEKDNLSFDIILTEKPTTVKFNVNNLTIVKLKGKTLNEDRVVFYDEIINFESPFSFDKQFVDGSKLKEVSLAVNKDDLFVPDIDLKINKVSFKVPNRDVKSAQIKFKEYLDDSLITGYFIYNTPVNTNLCYNCSDCNDAINNVTSGWTVKLGDDIFTNSSCIDINTKNDIVFDCDAHMITGDYTGYDTGINITNSDNLIIQNCDLKLFYKDITLYNTNNSLLKNNYMINSSYGISVDESNDMTYLNQTIHSFENFFVNHFEIYNSKNQNILNANLNSYIRGNSLRGIYVYNSENILINNLNSTKIANGIEINTVTNITITNSYFDNNYRGIHSFNDNITIYNSTFFDNTDGIRSNSNNLIVYDNYFIDNGDGISLYSGNLLAFNNYFNNTFEAININCISPACNATLNVANESKTTIIGTSNYGGNYWRGNNIFIDGYSNYCNDINKDNICDEIYNLSGFIDYYPLTNNTKIYCDSCESCTELINDSNINDTIYLLEDISTSSGSCVNIDNVENKTFDCNNNKIEYSPALTNGPIGITANNSKNISIINCKINNFDKNLYVENTNNSLFTNVTIQKSNFGIHTYDTSNNLFENINYVYLTGGIPSYGFLAVLGVNNTLKSIYMGGNPYSSSISIRIESGSKINLIDSIISDHILGVGILNSNDILINNTKINHNLRDLDIIGSSGTISNSNITNSPLAGVIYSSNLTFFNNRIVDGFDGIYIYSGNITFYNNYFKKEQDNLEINCDPVNCTINLNTSHQIKDTIIGTTNYGGNYWSKYIIGSGYSEICNDIDRDRECDDAYNISGFYDYQALTNNEAIMCDNCSDCNDLIEQGFNNTSYKMLNSDVVNGTCIEIINKTNITLNCLGNEVMGNTVGIGINIYESTYINIDNCKMNGFGIGLSGDQEGIPMVNGYITINNSEFNNNSQRGIMFYAYYNNNTILNTKTNYNDGAGISMSDSSYHTLINVTSNYNDHGIDLNSGSHKTKIINSETSYNTESGINYYWENWNIGLLENHTANGNLYGLYLYDAWRGEIKNSVFEDNTYTFVFKGASTNAIDGIKIYNNVFKTNNIYLNYSAWDDIYPFEFYNNTWLKMSGAGYSQTCQDANNNDYCDVSYNFASSLNLFDNNSNVLQNCSDGVLNQDEVKIDCGGSCSACPTSSGGSSSSSSILWPLPTTNESVEESADNNLNESSDVDDLPNDDLSKFEDYLKITVDGVSNIVEINSNSMNLLDEINKALSNCNYDYCDVIIESTKDISDFDIRVENTGDLYIDNNVLGVDNSIIDYVNFIDGKLTFDIESELPLVGSVELNIRYETKFDYDVALEINEFCIDYPCKIPLVLSGKIGDLIDGVDIK